MKKLILTVATIGLVLTACQKQEADIRAEVVVPVKVSRVLRQNISRPVITSGRLASSSEMKLSFKTGGIIDAFHVMEGQEVRKNAVLASLKLDEIEAQVQLAISAFEKAERDFHRVQNLYADSVATLEQLQDAKTGMQVARSRMTIARFNREHSVIRAPSRGTVLKKLAESNEMIGTGHPVFLFGASNQAWSVKVGVIDRDVVRLAVGDSASIVVDAFPDDRFPGRIIQIAGSPDPMNGTYEVELAVKARGKALFSGFIARVQIYPSERELLSLVDFSALVESDGHSAFVYTPTDSGRVRKKPVTLAFMLDDCAAIRSGLEQVQRVVTDGAAYLKKGAKIQIMNE